MKTSLILKFLGAPRPVKRLISIGYDTLAIIGSFYLAYSLRLGNMAITIDRPLLMCLAFTLVVSIFTFIRMGLYRAILRYMTQHAMITIFIGILISSLAMTLSAFFFQAFLPRSVPIIYVFTTLILIGLPRLVFRNVVKMVTPRGNINVVIYGAGETGNNLASQLRLSGEFNPVAFVDDEKRLHGSLSSAQISGAYRAALSHAYFACAGEYQPAGAGAHYSLPGAYAGAGANYSAGHRHSKRCGAHQ
jgi:FlaA1/EpsC-like NDP-sugar epimerase